VTNYTIRELRSRGRELLAAVPGSAASGVAGLETDLFLGEILSRSLAGILAHQDELVGYDAAEQFFAWIKRRSLHEPVAYIIGHREFYGRSFLCTPATLIPRPETELIVDRALEFLRENPQTKTVLDLGCGTGCIGLSIAIESQARDHFPHVYLSDIGSDCLALAERNARHLEIAGRVSFLAADCFAGIAVIPSLVVSNPPYISETEQLMPDVDVYEPARALRAGADGMKVIDRLLREWHLRGPEEGLVILEIGANQRPAVESLARRLGCRRVNFFEDLSGVSRVVEIAR
jgi:release factor glutamine methyltransferase